MCENMQCYSSQVSEAVTTRNCSQGPY